MRLSEVSCIGTKLLRNCIFGVGLPILVDLQIADPHVLDPVAVPLVQLGRLDASHSGPESPVRSRAVGADEHAEVERGPYIRCTKYRWECGCHSQRSVC